MSEQLTREQQARQGGFDICQAFLETLDALYPARARDATNPDRGTGLVGDRPVNVHDAMTRAWSLQAGFHNGTSAPWSQIQNQLSVLRRELWAGAQTSYNGPGRLCQVLSGHRKFVDSLELILEARRVVASRSDVDTTTCQQAGPSFACVVPESKRGGTA